MKKHKIIFRITAVFLFLFEGMIPLSTLVFVSEPVFESTLTSGYPEYFGYRQIDIIFMDKQLS